MDQPSTNSSLGTDPANNDPSTPTGAVTSSNTATWLWSLLVALVFISGAAWWVTSRTATSSAVRTTPTNGNEAKPATTQVTYTNTAFHYQLQHPSDWLAYDSLQDVNKMAGKADSPLEQVKSLSATFDTARALAGSIEIDVYPNPTTTGDVLSEAKRMNAADEVVITSTTFAGQPAAQIVTKAKIGGGVQTEYLVQRPGDAAEYYHITQNLRDQSATNPALAAVKSFTFTN